MEPIRDRLPGVGIRARESAFNQLIGSSAERCIKNPNRARSRPERGSDTSPSNP
jgi:hypothetical protein